MSQPEKTAAKPKSSTHTLTKTLLNPTVAVVVGTMYLYFLGWVVLYSKMVGLGLLHEMRNLPSQEYISCLALAISSWTLTAGVALVARSFSKRWWKVFLAAALYIHIRNASTVAVIVRDGGVDMQFVYPRMCLATLLASAGLLIALSVFPAFQRWLKARIVWRWGGRVVAVSLAMFCLFHDAVAHGLGQALQIVASQRSVWVRSKDPTTDEWLSKLNLGVLMQVGERWYFHDRDLTDRLLRVMPMGIAQDQIIEIRSFADPMSQPQTHSDMLKYLKEAKQRPATLPGESQGK